MCPAAGLLRGLTGSEAASRSLIGPVSSSSSEEELKKSGSSFSMFLSAPEEQPRFNLSRVSVPIRAAANDPLTID